MKWNTGGLLSLLAVFCVTSALSAGDPAGATTGTAEVMTRESLKRGGLLYDHWPKLVNFNPSSAHPLYPASGKKAGTTTWRCKECHGWDYQGRDGRYSSGSHYTGIQGVWHVRGDSPDTLRKMLTNTGGAHDFGAHLSPSDIDALVHLLREGMLPPGTAKNVHDGKDGDPKRGKVLYSRHCAGCHGEDGIAIDFNPKQDGHQGVGWLARKNPQETLHKIRWGHPGSRMPSGVADSGMTNEDSMDLLAYSLTL